MRYAKVPVYKFEELSDEAKRYAKNRHDELFGYSHSDEAIASLKKLAEHFDARLVDYSIDWSGAYSYSWARFELSYSESPELKSAYEAELKNLVEKLGDGSGECVLTGVITDEWAIDGVREAYQDGERDVERLLQAGFRSLLEACRKDYEDEYTDDSFAELCEANDYEFTEKGEIFRG